MDAQFEHLCRICAANTKSKTNSVVESVFIFKTHGLRNKIAHHLYLNVLEDDPLPKVLCKSCYRQVEATASLSNIAKHTQRVFRDFLLSTLPKEAREAAAAQLNATRLPTRDEEQLQPPQQPQPQPPPPPPPVEEFRPIMLTRIPETTITVAKPQAGNAPREEVASLSFSRASGAGGSGAGGSGGAAAKSTAAPTRRTSVFVDQRYGSAPMSIAQRSMQQPPSLVPLHSETTATSRKATEKKPSPAGVINFIQTHGRITGNVSITSVDEGGPRGSARNSAAATLSSAGVPNLPSNVLQQKRRNLKNALNNIKAIQSGQVSLLKSSQNRGQAEEARAPPMTTTSMPRKSLFAAEPSIEEALPEHMIFAAPKKKRDEEDYLGPSRPPKLTKIVPGINPNKSLEVIPSPAAPGPSNSGGLTEAISLGSVIRDPDLLKLVLKALKWPVSAGNFEEQMNRLKNSKFAVIMSDSNLLQDTDLTQLLGPYLTPMLALAQQQQEKQSPPATMIPSTSSSKDILSLTDLSSAMPYKLPPETSVQLVPSSPTELEPPPLAKPAKRVQRKGPRGREVSFRDPPATASNAAHVTNELLKLDAMVLSQFESNPADALNDALNSMLKEQSNGKEQRSLRRRRSASNSLINLEDIVLVEPQPPLDPEPVREHVVEPEPVTLQSPPTLVTRPIVKRRKTVIQSSKQSQEMEKTKPKPVQPAVSKQPEKKEPAVELPEEEEEEPPLEPSQAPTSTVEEERSVDAAASQEQADLGPENQDNTQTDNKAGGAGTTRKSEVKAALGQKLLEAIGLPQPGKDVAPENSRDSLRIALKRSLKQAQEQQQQQQQQLKRTKQEEPVKQLADSTTKPSASESADEHKKAIAERELALLKRKAAEEGKPVKDEKSERPDVSSSSSRNRRNRKSKTDAAAEESGDEEKKWDEDDDLPLKADGEKASPTERSASRNGNRPTRASKTLSKYYKGPSLGTKSQHSMGTRSTRQR
ncbi:hypothetical protein KR018_008350 [Drosophila ironensis]|nr:hypothetical protein KR018_008350 [Drosophila ironensis]